MADFSTKHHNPLLGKRLETSTEKQSAPLSAILSDVVGPIADVDSADSSIPVANALPSASTTPSLMTPPSASTAAADSAASMRTSSSLEVIVPISTAAVPASASMTAADFPTPTSLEVLVPLSTTAVPITECPIPDANAPSISSLPAAAASLSALDSVDTSGVKKVVQTKKGKKSTRMRPGATLTARCVQAN